MAPKYITTINETYYIKYDNIIDVISLYHQIIIEYTYLNIKSKM